MKLKLDKIGKEQGRGAYICYNVECLKKQKQKSRKTLGAKINDEIYGHITKAIIIIKLGVMLLVR